VGVRGSKKRSAWSRLYLAAEDAQRLRHRDEAERLGLGVRVRVRVRVRVTVRVRVRVRVTESAMKAHSLYK